MRENQSMNRKLSILALSLAIVAATWTMQPAQAKAGWGDVVAPAVSAFQYYGYGYSPGYSNYYQPYSYYYRPYSYYTSPVPQPYPYIYYGPGTVRYNTFYYPQYRVPNFYYYGW